MIAGVLLPFGLLRESDCIPCTKDRCAQRRVSTCNSRFAG